MSYKPEVVADATDNWSGNDLRFATKEEAEAYVSELSMRWFMVRKTRVIEVDDPVTSRWVGGEDRLIDCVADVT